MIGTPNDTTLTALDAQGDDDTFRDFPKHLQETITNNVSEPEVTSVVYPKYETKGELAQSTTAFLEWYFTPCWFILDMPLIDLVQAQRTGHGPPQEASLQPLAP